MRKDQNFPVINLFLRQNKRGKRAFLICLNFLLIFDYENKSDYITSFFLRDDSVIKFKKEYYQELIKLFNSIKENGYSDNSMVTITALSKQLIDGAHRTAICLFLKIPTITCKKVFKIYVKNDVEWFYTCGFSKEDLIKMRTTTLKLIK